MNKKNTLIKSLSLFVALFGAMNFGFGQEIASFSSLQNTACSSVVSNDVNITATGICRGSGISVNPTGATYNSRDWTIDATLDVDDYLEWTLTPNSDYQIDLTTMDIRYDRSDQGPTMVDIQINTGYGFTSIFTDLAVSDGSENNDGIDLSSFTSLTSTVTFRLYGYRATSAAGTFDIEERFATNKGIIINGTVTAVPPCGVVPTIWNGVAWDNGVPNLTVPAEINGTYDTAVNPNFSACSLIVNTGFSLRVEDNTFVEIQNDVTVNGTLTVETRGNFVQNSDSSTFTNNGASVVRKITALLASWVDYTYWSSPVTNLTIGTSPLVDSDRRFWYNAANYFDGNSDGLDDNADDWQVAGDFVPMTPGLGYAASHSQFGWFGSQEYNYNFFGEFNNGVITPPVSFDGTNPIDHWNLLGNPYPSAISVDDFFIANSGIIKEALYLWSHNSLIDPGNIGNEANNYNIADYAVINKTSQTAGSDNKTPERYIPSGQGFFVSTQAPGTVEFNNSMRMADGTSNSLFFKNSNSKDATSIFNKLWVNLTSDNGVFNQISVGYVDGATSFNDGASYDAKRITETYAFIYSLIDGSSDKFIIQGKSPNSLNQDEMISLGFDTNIDVPTVYTLSVAQLQGDFLTNNPVYLKDNVANTIHNLSDSDYAFTSGVGAFKDRFEIVFTNQALSNDAFDANTNTLQITQVSENQVRFSTSNNISIKNVRIYDLLGRPLYNLEGNNREETYNLSHLNNTVFIAKVELSNGVIVTKKAIKK